MHCRRSHLTGLRPQKLAAKHTDTLFLRADVANVPFLVNKLEIKVLPCVIGFVDGVSKMKCAAFFRLFDRVADTALCTQTDWSALRSCPEETLSRRLRSKSAWCIAVRAFPERPIPQLAMPSTRLTLLCRRCAEQDARRERHARDSSDCGCSKTRRRRRAVADQGRRRPRDQRRRRLFRP